MKKVYSKPNMEIVSFETESFAADGSALINAGTNQSTAQMKTIQYY